MLIFGGGASVGNKRAISFMISGSACRKWIFFVSGNSFWQSRTISFMSGQEVKPVILALLRRAES